MARRPDSTLPSRPVPVVVLIGPTGILRDVCGRLMPYLDEVPRIEVSDVKGAATSVARFHPFAIVLSEEVLAFDPEEFQALARDVGAELMTVAEGEGEEQVVALLYPRLKAALHRFWEREGERG